MDKSTIKCKFFFKKIIDDKSLPKAKDNLIKLWDKWKDRLETDWSLVKEQNEEVDNHFNISIVTIFINVITIINLIIINIIIKICIGASSFGVLIIFSLTLK